MRHSTCTVILWTRNDLLYFFPFRTAFAAPGPIIQLSIQASFSPEPAMWFSIVAKKANLVCRLPRRNITLSWPLQLFQSPVECLIYCYYSKLLPCVVWHFYASLMVFSLSSSCARLCIMGENPMLLTGGWLLVTDSLKTGHPSFMTPIWCSKWKVRTVARAFWWFGELVHHSAATDCANTGFSLILTLGG